MLSRYLLEDQIRGPSSVEGYIRALRAGCRCVESKSLFGVAEIEPIGVSTGRSTSNRQVGISEKEILYLKYSLDISFRFIIIMSQCLTFRLLSIAFPYVFSIRFTRNMYPIGVGWYLKKDRTCFVIFMVV